MKKICIKIMSAAMVAAIFAGVFTGCSSTDLVGSLKKNIGNGKNDVFANVEQRVVDVDVDLKSDLREKYAAFGFDLLKKTYDNKNQMVSPYSILSALAMVSNGAAGVTLDEFEDMFGMSITDMNSYLYLLGETMPNDKCKFNSANAVWVNDDKDIELDKDYLQALSDYFDSNLYKESFNSDVVDNINAFIKRNTNDMIPKMIDDLDSDCAMVLVNALAFEGEWEEKYEESQVLDWKFNNLDGSNSDIEIMSSTEGKYLEFDNGTGFIKNYKNSEYQFVGLLPDEDVDFEEFVNEMTGEKFINTVTNPEYCDVFVKIPKFQADYTVKLNDYLEDMGIESAFSPSAADFSAMTENQHHLYINLVLHKTFIDVSENGTKASAATVLEMKDEACAIVAIDEIKEVNLDRPFMYAIVDGETGTPVFIGMVTTM